MWTEPFYIQFPLLLRAAIPLFHFSEQVVTLRIFCVFINMWQRWSGLNTWNYYSHAATQGSVFLNSSWVLINLSLRIQEIPIFWDPMNPVSSQLEVPNCTMYVAQVYKAVRDPRSIINPDKFRISSLISLLSTDEECTRYELISLVFSLADSFPTFSEFNRNLISMKNFRVPVYWLKSVWNFLSPVTK